MGITDRKYIKRIFKNSVFLFLVMGGCSTGIDFILYMVMSRSISVTVSKGISMIAASIFSYLMNKKYTFRNKEKTDFGYLFRFYLIFAVNFLTNLFINYMVLYHTGYKIAAYIIATCCGMTVNYLGQKYIVFKRK